MRPKRSRGRSRSPSRPPEEDPSMDMQPTTQPPSEHDEDRSLRSPGAGAAIVPPVDIYETEKAYVILADMPGVRPDGVDVHLERDRLTVRGRVVATEDG